jgi:hypothetical protein
MPNLLEQCYQSVLKTPEALDNFITDETQWHVAHPINTLEGIHEIKTGYFDTLLESMPDAERKPFISFEGHYQQQHWVSASGYIIGTFVNDFLGIPATGKTLFLRYTELAQITDDKGTKKIKQAYTFIDVIDVMNQADVNPLRPSLGHDGLIMPPTTLDGLKTGISNTEQSQQSARIVNAMLAELGRYDGKSLSSMKLEEYWHSDFMWYGPAGIGTTRGISGFRKHHQGPFVEAFPDRGINKTVSFIANENYAATGGWPHMHGTHTSGNWLGLEATNKTVYPRVMDIWRREGMFLKENWVAIDIPDILKQMDIDIFALMSNKISQISE